MSKTLTTFTIGGVLGAAMFGGFAVASASTPPPSEPRPAVTVDPRDPAQPLESTLVMSAQSAPTIVTVASAPSVHSADRPRAVQQTPPAQKVVKPPVKHTAADSINSPNTPASPASAPSVIS